MTGDESPDRNRSARRVEQTAQGIPSEPGAADLSRGRRLDAPGDAVIRSLALLESSVAMTGNPLAVITQFGSYLNASRLGQSFTITPGCIGLRSAPGAASSVTVTVEEDPLGLVTTLHLLSETGRPIHRCRTASDGDRMIVESLDRREGARTVAEALAERMPPEHRPAGPGDDAVDQLAQLDALLDDAGRHRRRTMPAQDPHDRVDVSVLPILFEHLCTVGLPLGAVVVGAGVLQGAAGRLQATSAAEGGLMGRWNDATVELDLTGIAECLRVRTHAAHGETTALELYDDHQRCIALLGQFGIVGAETHATWQDVAASLPDDASRPS